MRSTRWPLRLALPTLGLALWIGLPDLQWCPYTWEQCRKAWASEPTEQARCMGADLRAVGDPGSCAGICENEPLLRTCADPRPAACPLADEMPGGPDVATACGPPSDPPPQGERAWCVGMHADGIVTRSLALPLPAAPSHPAWVADAPPLIVAPRRRLRDLPAAPCPGIPAAHSPPLTRAPPARA